MSPIRARKRDQKARGDQHQQWLELRLRRQRQYEFLQGQLDCLDLVQPAEHDQRRRPVQSVLVRAQPQSLEAGRDLPERHGSETTIYVGGILEKVTVPTGTGYRHYLGAGSAKVVYTRWSSGLESTRYVTTDHLNSSTVVMDSAGASLVNLSFAAFGARRGAAWSGTPSSGDWTQINNATRQGYTGHEHLDNINIIHMNGRVFEPALGRFLSADPFMPGSLGSQASNRFAYVGNQSLSLIDPSGYWPRAGNALKAWRSDPSNADTISPWEEAAFMQAQLAWHQMFPGGDMVNGIPMMQTVTGRQVAQARRDYGYVSASSLLPQYSFRSQTSVYIYPPGADVTEPIVISVMGQENFWFPTGFGITGQWSTTFQRPGTTQATPAPSNKPQPSPQEEEPIKNWLCEAGNSVAEWADGLGNVSGKLELAGLGIAGVGFVTAQPEITAPGLALAATGGIGNIGAGVLQLGAGLLQGAGGGGFSNAGYATLSLATGFTLARGILGPAVSGYRTVSQRAGDAFRNGTATVAGGVNDVWTSLIDAAAPRQVSCPGGN
ncbi:MAG: RHS repeat-associated core domain-containing protein [Hyphomicrobium sp.]